MADGVLEADATGMEGDAAIGETAGGTVLKVATDGTADVCKLGAYLVVSACLELYF